MTKLLSKTNGDNVKISDNIQSYDINRRVEILEELYKKYAGGAFGSNMISNKIRFFLKRNAWNITVGGTKILKRTFDIIAAGLALFVLIPMFMTVAVLIKMTDGGTVFFAQKRVGRWGKEFSFPKFRSMVPDADKIKDQLIGQSHHENSITFKMKKDPRITWIGRIIRKLSIDELPQLWSVFIGDMSLVGPRPPLPGEVAEYSLKDRRRLDVIPGLTCTWQVSGRGDIPFKEQARLDVDYIESQSLRMDIKLMLKTIPAVLFGRGAY